MRRHNDAFTLVELLVVIGVIAMLISILMPAIMSARRSAQAVECAANLRTIGVGVEAYARANKGYIHRAQNWASWLDTWAPPGDTVQLRLINPNATNAYWGSAYFPYMTNRTVSEATGDSAKQIIEVARRMFHCPSSVSMEMDNARMNADPTNPVSYGVNGRLTTGTSSTLPDGTTRTIWSRLKNFRPPATTIFAQDAVEMRMEDKQADSLSPYDGPANLTAWRPGGVNTQYKLDGVYEYFRHNRHCQVLYLDWHVGVIGDKTLVAKRDYEGHE